MWRSPARTMATNAKTNQRESIQGDRIFFNPTMLKPLSIDIGAGGPRWRFSEPPLAHLHHLPGCEFSEPGDKGVERRPRSRRELLCDLHALLTAQGSNGDPAGPGGSRRRDLNRLDFVAWKLEAFLHLVPETRLL